MINLRRFKLLSILKPNNFYFVPTFQFARKNKPTPPTDNDKTESTTTDPQTIRVISEDVPLRIAPYFDTGIEKDKVVFKLEEKNKEEVPQGQGERKKSKKKLKKEEEMRGQQQERVKKRKLNITLENIKRELPKDM